jgi:hypothetical protein
MTISTEWYVGCSTEADRAKRRALVETSEPLLDVLSKVISNRRKTIENVRETDYDIGGWAYLQAHRNGRLEELDRLETLVGRDQ